MLITSVTWWAAPGGEESETGTARPGGFPARGSSAYSPAFGLLLTDNRPGEGADEVLLGQGFSLEGKLPGLAVPLSPCSLPSPLGEGQQLRRRDG